MQERKPHPGSHSGGLGSRRRRAQGTEARSRFTRRLGRQGNHPKLCLDAQLRQRFSFHSELRELLFARAHKQRDFLQLTVQLPLEEGGGKGEYLRRRQRRDSPPDHYLVRLAFCAPITLANSAFKACSIATNSR